jgi:hypothetical protein
MNSLFSSESESIFMMNTLAIMSFSHDIKILVSQVMDTHFHLIASGAVRSCARFVSDLLVRLKIYLNRKGNRVYATGNLEISLDPVKDATDLKSKFMYVYRNALVAGYRGLPWMYEWGPGDIYFADHDALGMVGKPLNVFPKCAIRKMFHTDVVLPREWRVNDKGMLLPHCYMDWKRVEQEFGSPKVFIAFMHQKRDLECVLDGECNRSVVDRFSETELKREANEMAVRLYNRRGIADASPEERIFIAKGLWQNRRTYSVSVLSRVTLVDRNILKHII